MRRHKPIQQVERYLPDHALKNVFIGVFHDIIFAVRFSFQRRETNESFNKRMISSFRQHETLP